MQFWAASLHTPVRLSLTLQSRSLPYYLILLYCWFLWPPSCPQIRRAHCFWEEFPVHCTTRRGFSMGSRLFSQGSGPPLLQQAVCSVISAFTLFLGQVHGSCWKAWGIQNLASENLTPRWGAISNWRRLGEGVPIFFYSLYFFVFHELDSVGCSFYNKRIWSWMEGWE